MTQDIPLECVTSCLDLSFLSEAWRGFWPCCSKITFLHALPPLSPSPARQPHPSGETQDSRELHRAPKNPGLHRQRPGFTHTSSSRQTSSPSQMAEKHPTQVGRPGVRPGDTLPLSLTPSGLPPSRAASPGLGGWVTARTPALGLRRANRPQEARKEGSLGSVLPSPPVGGASWLLTGGAFSIFLPPAWAALELSRGAVGQRGVSRGAAWLCRWITVPLRHGVLPQPHRAGLAKSHSPRVPDPFLLCPWPSHHLPPLPTTLQAVPAPLSL